MTYIPNQPLSITSANGINSDNVISGGNWVLDTYTGLGEENDYAYIGVNLQVDENGTLFFDFSQDGVNWSTYPVNGFTVVSGVNEVHTAWKGGRYMRPRFVGSGGRTYFRLKTYYSNLPLPLTAPVNQSIGGDQDAQVVRAVGIGANPTGDYVNQKIDGSGFRTTATVAAGATFDSGVIDAQVYTQVQTNIISDKDGTIRFIFGSSPTMSGIVAGVNGVDRVLSVPYSAAAGFQMYSAPAFTPYVRYEFTNNEATDTTHFFYETKLLTKGLTPQLLRLDGFVANGMVSTLTRSISTGQQPSGVYVNEKADGVLFSNTTPLSANTDFVSSWYNTDGFDTVILLVESDQLSDVGGIVIEYADDVTSPIVRKTDNFSFDADAISRGYLIIPLNTILGGLRITYQNGAAAQGFFFIQANAKTQQNPFLPLEQNIESDVNVALGRSILSGATPTGNYKNVSVTETTNDEGTYNNLNVVSGARPSQLSGRAKVNAVVDISADSNIYTPSVGKTFYVTDFFLTINNADVNIYGRVDIRDSLTAGGGTLVLPLLTQESPNNETAVQVFTHTFSEPIEFSTAVYFDVIQGTLDIAGVLIGYEE